jgi:hypothetical protein
LRRYKIKENEQKTLGVHDKTAGNTSFVDAKKFLAEFEESLMK